jgi:N-hydroxyarylamine O-acetyltransferase
MAASRISSRLDQYLKRIGYSGPRRPDLGVLRAIHRHHLAAIAYENVDVVLGTPVDLDLERIHDKIVIQGRGGWCYEMNGLLGWALDQLGFRVTRMCGGVLRADRGDEAIGNHLVLCVDLEGAWIADVGLGDGLIEPIPLREGEHEQGSSRFRLERLDAGDRRDRGGVEEWRFHNRDGALPPTFDFFHRPADEARLAEVCQQLQTDPDSIFRQTLICQRLSAEGQQTLLGRVLRSGPGDRRRLVASPDELVDLLQRVFGLQLSALPGHWLEAIWKKVTETHDRMFGDRPLEEIQFGTRPE